MATTRQRRQHKHPQKYGDEQDHDQDDDDHGDSTTDGQNVNPSHRGMPVHSAAPSSSSLSEPEMVSSSSLELEESASTAAARGTLITFVLKIFSFGCTQLVIRFLDPSKLGQAHIQLELLLTTILFISREGFRLALTTSSQTATAKSWSVAWLTIPFVTIISGIVLVCHLLYTSSGSTTEGDGTAAADAARRDYQVAGILMIVASWIEACGEPPVLYFLRKLQVHVRVAGETVASLGKTVTTVICFHLLAWYSNGTDNEDDSNSSSDPWQVTVLGVAQLVYAVTYTFYMYWQANKIGGRDWLQHIPGWAPVSSTPTESGIEYITPSMSTKLFWDGIDRETLWMVTVFTLQGFFKHLLTEADRIVLSNVANNYDQGVYAMASSYGSLAARILLQPLEENARLLWGRLAAAAAVANTTEGTAATLKKTRKQELMDSYTTLVKLVLYVGLIFSCIGVNYTNLLLNILAGRTWGSNGEAGLVLSAFCVYTAFLAMNGMTEAFVYSVANLSSHNDHNDDNTKINISGGEMGRLSIVHTFTGIVFALSSSFLVTRYGTIGLVGANCLAMSVRALYSIFFAAKYFEDVKPDKEEPNAKNHISKIRTTWSLIGSILPHPVVLSAFLLAVISTKLSLTRLVEQEYHLRLDIRNKDWLLLTSQHVTVGVACIIGIMTMAAMFDRKFVRSLKGMIRKKKSPSVQKSHQD